MPAPPSTPPFGGGGGGTSPFGGGGGTPPPPFGGGGSQQPPTAPPPLAPPPKPLASALAIDPGAIVGCLFRNTYIWPDFGPGFWFYPIFVGRTSVAGFRWTGRNWIFSGFDLGRISSFSCF
ncbi:transporter [Cohnella fermenti]|uniref:Transporter n=1 Tax=Cohnella fermenti TaxID=2565925 RepID=A0A4S4CAB1_9BACL|nr:transporter [Cohnella fermenti]